jgi:hypothetical protein
LGNDNVKDYPPYLDYPKPRKPQTNADRIRAWSDEEIAEFTVGIVDGMNERLTGEKIPADVREEIRAEWLDWLKKEVEE